MAEKSGFKNTTYIHIAIGIALMFAGWLIPPFATLTPVGVKVLFIFIGVIYLWSTVETFWSSLLCIVALGFSGYSKSLGELLTTSFGNSTLLLVLFTMILFGGVVESGVAHYIARFFLTRKISNGRPFVFSGIFTFGIYVVAALTNTMTALMLSWPLAYAILDELHYTKQDSFSKFFIFCAFLGSIFGQITIPFRGAKPSLIQAFVNNYGGSWNYGIFILFDVIMVIVLIIGLMLLCKFVFKCDVSRMKNLSVDELNKNPLPPMSKTVKFYLWVCILYIISILVPTMADPSIPVIKFLNQFGTVGITILWVVFCCILRLDGKPVLDLRPVAAKHVQWNVLMLVMIALVMSTALTADATGIKPLIMDAVGAVLGGKGQFGAAAILITFSFLLTNVANNFVSASLIMPIWGSYAATAGIDAAAAPGIATCTLLCLYLAFLLPAASPFAGMLWSNREWLQPADILRMGIPFAIWVIVAFCTVGYFLSIFLYGLVV